MDFFDFLCTEDEDGRRLDKIIPSLLPKIPSSEIFKTIRKRLIRINMEKTSADFKAKNGDKINIASFLVEKFGKEENKSENDSKAGNDFPKDKDDSLEEPVNFSILLKNDNFLAISKPYDIPVQPSKDFEKGKSLCEIIQKKYPGNRDSLSFKAGALHRLDRKTTGVLFFSQSHKGALFFSEKIKEHSLKKTYFAILEGHIAKSQRWIDYLKKEDDNQNPDSRQSQKNNSSNKTFHTVKAFKTEEKGSKIAITNVSPIRYGSIAIAGVKTDVTLAEIQIETGRTHQIRCQSSFHSHPLLGDISYGGKKISAERDFFLHAKKIEFSPEILKEAESLGLEKTIESPLPKDFINFLEKCGIYSII